MRIFTIIFILLFQIICDAQKRPYEQLELISDAQPLWYETSYHPDIYFSNGYNKFFRTFFPPLVHGNYIYTAYAIKGQGQWGISIEKRNSTTGELVWQQKYDKRDVDREEMFKTMYINNDNHLIVLSIRRVKEYKDNEPLFEIYDPNCRLLHRTFDIETGELLSVLTPTDDDSKAVVIAATDIKSSTYPNLFRTTVEGEYIFTQAIRKINGIDQKDELIGIVKIDKLGLPISDVDTLNLGYGQGAHNLFQLGYDSLIFLEVDSSKTSMKLKTFDHDFNFIKSVQFDPIPMQIGYVVVQKIDHDYILISNYLENGPFATAFLALYDFNGTLLDYYNLPDGTNINTLTFNYFKKHKKLVLITHNNLRQTYQTSKPVLRFYVSDGLGSLLKKQEWSYVDTLRYGNPYDIMEIGDDKILIHFGEGSLFNDSTEFQNLFFDSDARAVSKMLFNASDLGLTPVSVADVHVDKSDFSISPNPAYSIFTILISDDLPFTGTLYITDMMGHSVYNREIKSESAFTIDISALPAGMYHVIMASHGVKSYKVKKLIKIN